MKIAVYTFISGQYDKLKPFDEEFTKEADFYYFTDAPQETPEGSGKYKTIIVPIEPGFERYTSRHYKIMSHALFSGYDYIIWLDGTTSLIASPKRLIEKYLNSFDIAAFKYPDEDCIYVHAEKCVAAGRFPASLVNLSMEQYWKEGFPENAGLCELRILLRKNTDKITQLNRLWLKTYKRWLTCDQLCFNYCIWKLGIKYNTIEWGSPEFKTKKLHDQYRPHRYPRQ